MAKEITIIIDTREIHVPEGSSILEAADRAGIYIPRLCHRPGLPSAPGTKADPCVYRFGEINSGHDPHEAVYGGCSVCVVEVEGEGIVQSCATPAREGMVIHSDSTTVREARRTNLALILALHPHACMLCAQKEGCDREECSQGVEKHERCCSKFDDCELRKVSEYVTVPGDAPRYIYRDIPVVETPFFTFDANRCIGCIRCVRVCGKTRGKRVVGFAVHDNTLHIGTTGPSHKESGCAFCGACVLVCPAGALKDKGLHWKKKAEIDVTPIVLPPENDYELTEENIRKVPEANGVYLLLDEKRNTLYIRGALNMRSDLEEKRMEVAKARFFRYEEHGMYTMRETEMLEKYLNKNGKLPEVNDEISDLY